MLVAEGGEHGDEDGGSVVAGGVEDAQFWHLAEDAAYALRREVRQFLIGEVAAQEVGELAHGFVIHLGGYDDDLGVGEDDVEVAAVGRAPDLRLVEGGEVDVGLQGDVDGDGHLAVA